MDNGQFNPSVGYADSSPKGELFLPPLQGRWILPQAKDGGVVGGRVTPQSPAATAPLQGSL